MSPAAPATVPVTMTVGQGQGSQLTFNPASLALSAAVGGAPVVQAVTVSGTAGGPSASFTAQATSQGNSLSVTPTAGTTPLPLQITATPALLAAGTYLGTITVTPTGGTASTLNVTFTIGGQGQSVLTANPATLSFNVAPNSGPTPAQTLVASSSSALLTRISVVPSTVGGGTWLAVTPLSGNAPLTLSVSVNPQGLAAGTYTGSLALSAAGSSEPPLAVPVSLTVQNTQSSTLLANPAVLTFNATPSASRTQSQTISLSTSNGTALQVTASIAGGAWISVNPVGVTTPGTLTVSINANGLADGVYQATINLNSPNSSPVSVPVTLNVGSGSTGQSEPFPTSLNFEVQSGRPLPGAQLISVGGSGTFAATGTTSAGGSWLQVAPASGSLPGAVLVRLAESVVTALPAGTYTGSVTLSPTGTTGGSRTVPVRLNVGNGPALTSNAPILSFTAGVNGTAPNPVTVVVNSTSGTAIPVQAAATVQSGAGWLTVTSSSVTTPASLVLTVNPAGLAAGTYTGTVTVSSSQPGVASLVLPVRLQVQSGNLLNVSSNQLVFSATGTTPPASQTISLSASSGTGQYAAIAAVVSPSGGSWLTVQPTSGSLPGTITVSASPAGLASGDYAGTITITSASATGSVVIPVLFTVTGSTSAGLVARPSTLTFTPLPGGTPPGSQTLQLTAPASASFTASATTVSGGNWLSVNPTSGQAPGLVTVIISNTASLAAGS